MTTRQFILSCKRFKPENFAEMNVPLASSISFQTNLLTRDSQAKFIQTPILLLPLVPKPKCLDFVSLVTTYYNSRSSQMVEHLFCTISTNFCQGLKSSQARKEQKVSSCITQQQNQKVFQGRDIYWLKAHSTLFKIEHHLKYHNTNYISCHSLLYLIENLHESGLTFFTTACTSSS